MNLIKKLAISPAVPTSVSMRWIEESRLARWLGPRHWIVPSMLNLLTRSIYAIALLIPGLAGCLHKSSLQPGQNSMHFPTRRIAVIPFESSNPYLSGTAFSDCFTVQIIQNLTSVQVIERKDLMKILQEQKLTLTGVIRPEKFSKLGQILGVDAILVGNVETLEVLQSGGGTISITVKLMEVASGRILWADRQKISYATWSAREVPEVASILMEKAAKKITHRLEKSFALASAAPGTLEERQVEREAKLVLP